MANPAITGNMSLYEWAAEIAISTTTTENILGNTAGSSKVMEITSLVVHNADGTNSATIEIWKYNQDGTPMNDDTGNFKVAIGADVVAGSAIARVGPATLEIAAGGSQIVIDKLNPLRLHEDQSIVIQASAANDLDINMNYTVKG